MTDFRIVLNQVQGQQVSNLHDYYYARGTILLKMIVTVALQLVLMHHAYGGVFKFLCPPME